MGRVQFPLSGNVNQAINPWTWVYSPTQIDQASLFTFNVDLGPSTNAAVEKNIIGDVASYGKQLGRIEDALRVVIDVLEALVKDERSKDHTIIDDKIVKDKAIIAFKALMYEIDNVKQQHKK